MMSEKVTQLTNGAIRSIIENYDSTTQYYVQILKIENNCDTNAKFGTVSQCVCSDGFAKMNLHILNLSPSITSNISKQNPIIQILELKRSKSFFLVTKHEVIYLDKSQIGQPIDYEEYKKQNYTNPNGDREIQFAKAPYKLQVNSNKKQSSIKQEEFQQQIQQNENIDIDQQQAKSGVKLSNQQKQLQYKPPIQKIENQIYQQPNDQDLLKISELYPGMRGFKIKGRITSKSDITPFKSGKGKLFSIEIIDADKSTIQGIFFNQACDKFFDKVEIGKVYYFENGQIKTNRYSSKNQAQSDYQIHFEDFSKISDAKEDKEIDIFPYQIKKIEEIDSLQVDDKCDVLGVIIDIKPLTHIMTKSNENKAKKNITLYDQSGRGIDVVIWGTQAERWQFQKDDIVAFRGLKITDYQTIRSLTVTNQTIYEKKQSNLEKINGFQEFYEFYSQNKDFIEQKPKESKKKFALSYIEQIKKDFEGTRDNKPTKFYEIRAYLTTIFNKPLFYEGCDICKRKINFIPQTKQYHCQNCDQNFDKPSFKYIFNAKIADTTGNLIVSVSNEIGERILKVSCNDFQKKSDSEKSDCLKRANYQEYRFLIVAKMETYNDERRARYQISSIIQDEIVEDNQELYKSIMQILNTNE
ncbi:unnamed protein product [Paramecium sonneborni]|uniref:Replication protein A subunit n=1 Tax=Paramecium sonneborni TaxID=65129 RepID=A0A8S1LB30_9CILI|nr:unnamed protein product [Paramecium sonneborni]